MQNDRSVVLRCESKVHDRRAVKNSGGFAEKRYVIKALFHIGDDQWEIELTLANRDSMGYRISMN